MLPRRLTPWLAALLAAAAPIAPEITAQSQPFAWAGAPEPTQERALAEQAVRMVALLHEGEARSEAFLDSVYRAAPLERFASRTLALVGSEAEHAPPGEPCPRFAGIECADHRDVLHWARARFAPESSSGEDLALPMHLWLAPDGQVLLSAPFELDSQELGWCFATALARLGSSWPDLEPDARAPRRLRLGEAYGGADHLPFARGWTAQELEPRLRALRAGKLPAGLEREELGALFFTAEPEAVAFVQRGIGRSPLIWRGNEDLAAALRLIGRLSPPPFAAVLEEHAKDERPEVRNEVAVALEQLGSASSLKAVRAALKREKDPRVERNWVRALGACGYADRSARRALLKLAAREKDELLRRNAIFALGYSLADEDVAETLVELLTDDSPPARQAAACAMALSREARYVEPLRAAMMASGEDATDGDPETRAVLRRALNVLRGAPLASLEETVGQLCGARVPRPRVFF